MFSAHFLSEFDQTVFNVRPERIKHDPKPRQTPHMQCIVKKVVPGSIAEKAGMEVGDMLLAMNGHYGLTNFQVVDTMRASAGRDLNMLVVKAPLRVTTEAVVVVDGIAFEGHRSQLDDAANANVVTGVVLDIV